MVVPEEARIRAANEILRVIPGVMRLLASKIRQEPGGLAPAHFRLLFMLTQEPRSLTELADSQSVSLATMSNTVKVLVERGWIARQRDPADRRRLALEVTRAGRDVLKDVHAKAELHLSEVLAGLDEDQCRDLMRGLGVLNAVFENPADGTAAARREAE